MWKIYFTKKSIKMNKPEIKLIQYVIVSKRPRMSKGKIASQVAHATFRALVLQDDSDSIYLIEEWKQTGMCVIVLQCKNQQELMNISKYLDTENIINHIVIDEGLTEIPMGTATALATGVLPESEHWRFSKMRLFK